MGRSVSTPHDAYLVTFCDWFTDSNYEDEDGEVRYREPDHMDWECYTDSVTEYAKQLWPSLRETRERWLGREDRVYLENDLVYFGISEYCGVAAIWMVPKKHNEHLAVRWCDQISRKFNKSFGNLVKLGVVSNGKTVYKRFACE